MTEDTHAHVAPEPIEARQRDLCLVLFRVTGTLAPTGVRAVREDTIKESTTPEGRPAVLLGDFYRFPLPHERVRSCPPDLAAEIESVEAEIRAAKARRRDLLDEAWRRADTYRRAR